jgi:uncharacterized membrane protein YfcA
MLLGALFTLVAIFYASVGFGGGSSYLALLVLWGLPYAMIPVIALVCNILVVSGNSLHYARAGYIHWRLLLPPMIASIPMAYLGGRLDVDRNLFVIILFVTLLLTGIRLLIKHRQYDDELASYNGMPVGVGLAVGAVLGLLAGIVGIGGGIFLAPILYSLRAAAPKVIAATASLFILVNSMAGLLGQLHKQGIADALWDYWYLPVVVLVGGQIGNLLTIKFMPARIVALLTSLLVLFVAGRLGWYLWMSP